MQDFENFELKFSSKEVTAWGGLALLKKMLDAMDFNAAMQQWQLPQPGSNRVDTSTAVECWLKMHMSKGYRFSGCYVYCVF